MTVVIKRSDTLLRCVITQYFVNMNEEELIEGAIGGARGQRGRGGAANAGRTRTHISEENKAFNHRCSFKWSRLL